MSMPSIEDGDSNVSLGRIYWQDDSMRFSLALNQSRFGQCTLAIAQPRKHWQHWI